MGGASTVVSDGPDASLQRAEDAMEAGDVDEAVAHLSAAVRGLTATSSRTSAGPIRR